MKKKNSFYKNIFFYFLFLFIFIIGFFLRIYDIDKNPPGFFADEASIGYNAYSILKTGKDEWGKPMPIFFKAFGEYKNPFDIYATVPFVKFFGLNEFSVRLSSIIFSLLSGIVIFFIGKKSINFWFGLILMTIFMITPWSIHLARINFEGFNILLFFLLISFYYLNNYYKNKNSGDLIFFSFFSAIATYAYFPARIVVPIFFSLVIFFIFLTNVKLWKLITISLIMFFFISVPLINHIVLGEGLSRWRQVSVFNKTNLHPIKKITNSYFLHFSPDFLFFKGDIGMEGQFITRHSIRGIGQFYLWQFPLIIMGFYYLIKKKIKLTIPLMLLLILYPLPSSLTQDVSPQATRSLVGIIPFTFLTGYGVWYFLSVIKKISKYAQFTFFSILFLVIIYSLVNFINLLKQYPLYSADFWGWQYGPKEIINYFMQKRNNYDELYMTGYFNAPEIFLKFYDPEKKCINCFVGGLDRVNLNKKQLFALRVEEIKTYPRLIFRVKKIIYYPNGKEAFYIIEFISVNSS